MGRRKQGETHIPTKQTKRRFDNKEFSFSDALNYAVFIITQKYRGYIDVDQVSHFNTGPISENIKPGN